MYKGLMYGTRIKIKLRLSHKYTHFPTLTSYIADAELSTPCRINSCTSLSLDKGLVWKSFTPASKKSSRSDCNAFPVRAMIGVFTPIIRNFLVACNSERNFENNISRTIHRRNQLISPGLYTTKKIKSLRMFTHLMAIHDWHLLIHENKIV
jgi:hypothetical protein